MKKLAIVVFVGASAIYLLATNWSSILAYTATISWLEERVRNCHPQNVQSIQRQLAEARAGTGSTLFQMLVKIIKDHDDITLKLA